MSDPAAFAKSARRACWIAGRILGWRPDEFWTATPSELVGALNDPADTTALAFSRDHLNQLMELDAHGR